MSDVDDTEHDHSILLSTSETMNHPSEFEYDPATSYCTPIDLNPIATSSYALEDYPEPSSSHSDSSSVSDPSFASSSTPVSYSSVAISGLEGPVPPDLSEKPTRFEDWVMWEQKKSNSELESSSGVPQARYFSDANPRSWNEEYQLALDLPHSSFKYRKLANIAQDFVYASESYGKIIISEHKLPLAQRTFKPVNIGGIAGMLFFNFYKKKKKKKNFFLFLIFFFKI